MFERLLQLGKFFYQFIFPLTVVISLLLISGNISRPLFSGSILLDFLARFWLCLIFAMGYIIISDLDKYQIWFYGHSRENLGDPPDTFTIFWNICMSLMLGIFATLISWWAVRTFLPILNHIALLLALLNGFLFSMPLLYQSSRFRY